MSFAVLLLLCVILPLGKADDGERQQQWCVTANVSKSACLEHPKMMFKK
jgi:hypothetical protein